MSKDFECSIDVGIPAKVLNVSKTQNSKLGCVSFVVLEQRKEKYKGNERDSDVGESKVE